MPRLTNRARKDFDKLPPALSGRAREIISRLDNQPHLGKKLLGPLQGKRSIRLGRSHRIIYTLVDGEVIVLTITPRRDAYR